MLKLIWNFRVFLKRLFCSIISLSLIPRTDKRLSSSFPTPILISRWAVEELKAVGVSEGRPKFESTVQEMYDTFIAAESPLAINIDHDTRTDIIGLWVIWTKKHIKFWWKIGSHLKMYWNIKKVSKNWGLLNTRWRPSSEFFRISTKSPEHLHDNYNYNMSWDGQNRLKMNRVMIVWK